MFQSMKIQKRHIDIITTFISGLVLCIIGIILLRSAVENYSLFIYLSATFLFIMSFVHLFKAITKKHSDFFFSAIELAGGILILTAPNLPLSMLSLIFGLYLLITSIIYLINFFLMKKGFTKTKSLLLSIISFALSVFIYIMYHTDRFISVYIMATYFLIWGISLMLNSLIDLLFKNANNPKIRVCLPAGIDCLIPNMWLNRVNKYYREQKEEIEVKKENQEHDLEVFIHASHNGFNTFGHVDVLFEGTLYSYGNYDGRSERFFSMIGDGVVFKTQDREAYIRFCLKRCKKTLFVFGLKLTEEQKESVKKHIEKLNQDMVLWNPDFIHDPLKKGAPSIDLHVHQIFHEAKGTLYKFKKGTFKTYYVFGNNCVRFVDTIIGKNIDIIKLVGFITPGTYLDYFDGEFNRFSSNVVSREIYSIYNYDIGEEDENDPYKDFD